VFNEGTIAVMRKNAAATLVIDKSGKLVESLALHPEGVEAPFRVVLILERTGRNECEPRAEIGLRGVHPYRRPHKFWLGPPAACEPLGAFCKTAFDRTGLVAAKDQGEVPLRSLYLGR